MKDIVNKQMSNMFGVAVRDVVSDAMKSIAATAFKHGRDYATGLLFDSVYLIDDEAYAVVGKLQRDYRRLHSGFHRYVSTMIEIDNPYNWRSVVFKKPRGTHMLFSRDGNVLLANSTDYDSVTLSFIRGTVDVDKLIREALEEHDMLTQSNTINRFRVVRVVGEEDDDMPVRYVDKSDEKAESEYDQRKRSERFVTDGSTIFQTIDKNFDHPINYDRSRFLIQNNINPFDFLFYSQQNMAAAERAKKWFQYKNWYFERHIPWRLGMLFHGVGGTGKSEMAKSIAKSNGVPIYQYFLNTLSDEEFVQRWNSMETPCIALFEDFDNVFHKRDPQGNTKMSFDCLLNQISGVGARDGVLLIVTTNHIEHIDEAMGVTSEYGSISTRPGRIDMVLEFGSMGSEQRSKMAANILRDWPEIQDDVVTRGEGMTPVQFQELCIQESFRRMQ